MPRLLVVSPPTIDLINGKCRAGGTGLYAGATASMLGWNAYAIGPYGYVSWLALRVESLLGVVRLGYIVNGRGLVFRLEYFPSGRRVYMIGDGVVFDHQEVLKSTDGVGWFDAVLVSPVYGEEIGVLPPLLSSRSRIIALDVQGYVRSGLEVPGSGSLVSIIHSGEDEGEGPSNVLLRVVTSGYGSIRLFYRNKILSVLDPVGPQLTDPTGAGDSFTGALLVYLGKGYPVEDAVILASEAVSSLLPLIHEQAGIDCMFDF